MREPDGPIETQGAALSPCRVERLVPERFPDLGNRLVELVLLAWTETAETLGEPAEEAE